MRKSGEKKKVSHKEQGLFQGTENQTDGSSCNPGTGSWYSYFRASTYNIAAEPGHRHLAALKVHLLLFKNIRKSFDVENRT